MALSERGKNIRFVAIAIAVLLVVAAVWMLFFGFSKSHELNMDGYEITADGIRELRVHAIVRTHDYLIWDDEMSGHVSVYDGDEEIEAFQMVRRNNRYLPKRTTEEAYQEDLWREKVWVCESPYAASTNFFAINNYVVVDDDMEWLVVTNAFRADVEPRIWVFATDRDVGYDVTERAIAQFSWQFEGETPLQNPWG